MACPNCGCTEVDKDPARGDAVCTGCGNVLEDTLIVSEVQFAENSGGGSSVIGQFVSAEGGSAPSMTLGTSFHPGIGRESRTLTLQKGRRRINDLCSALKLNQHCCDMAYNFYKMAVMRGITRGRKTNNVLAACVYLVCRTEGTPHMLLDFSDVLQINVYTLGKTYLAITRLLCINTPVIDPSLMIPRFAHKLEFGEKEHEVSMTAMRLVARMKRDWMAVGRRPSGLCGAALLVAARIHNFCRLKKDIIKIVKVCESTLRKRLVEFEETASGSLTIDQFQTIDLEEEADPPCFTQSRKEAKLKQLDEQMLTNEINTEITDLSEEFDKELETKSLKKAQQLELEAQALLQSSEVVGDLDLEDPQAGEYLQKSILNDTLNGPESEDDNSNSVDTGVNLRPTAASLGITGEPTRDELRDQNVEQEVDNPTGELDLTGIDDSELDEFILTDEEMKMKQKVWMSLNGEFLKEQEEKAKRKAEEEASKPPKQKKKRRRANTTLNASSAGEAMEKMLQEKKISTKINYDVLKNLTSSGPLMSTINKPVEQDVTSSAVAPDVVDIQQQLLPVVYESGQVNTTSKRNTSFFNKQKPNVSLSSRKSSSKPVVDASHAKTVTQTKELAKSVVIESHPVVIEENTVSQVDDEEDEEDDHNDEDEPVSAAQLLGHSYSGYGCEDDDYYD